MRGRLKKIEGSYVSEVGEYYDGSLEQSSLRTITKLILYGSS